MNSDSTDRSKKVYLLARKIYLEKQKNPKLELDYFIDNFSDQFSKEEINIAFFVADHPLSNNFYLKNLLSFLAVFIIVYLLRFKYQHITWEVTVYTLFFGSIVYFLNLRTYKENLQLESISEIINYWFGGVKVSFQKNISLVKKPYFYENFILNYLFKEIDWGKYEFEYMPFYSNDGIKEKTNKYYLAINKARSVPCRILIYNNVFEDQWNNGQKIKYRKNISEEKLFLITEKAKEKIALSFLSPDLLDFLENNEGRGIYDAIEINNEMIFMSFPEFQVKMKPYFIGKLLFFDIKELLMIKREMEIRMGFLVELKKRMS